MYNSFLIIDNDITTNAIAGSKEYMQSGRII